MKRVFVILILSLVGLGLSARDSKFTRHGSGPKYWIAYEWCFDNDKALPEQRWKNNIDWIAEVLKPYGYDMICNDGWIEGAQSVNENGYITKYNSGWLHDFRYWNDYIESKGLKVGVYYNPMWLTRKAFFDNCLVDGTTDIHASDIVGEHSFNGDLFWVDVNKDGAEEWIKGYVRYFKNLGVKYLRIDFLENYERNYGTASYQTALRWISEEAGDELFLSLVMPNCFNHGEVEIQYGDMIRVSNDCFKGGWDFVSQRNRGRRRSYWPQYDNLFDGLIAFSDITNPGQLIADGDFMRLASLQGIEEMKFEFSLMVMAGSALAVADEYDTATKDVIKVYTNRELLALNEEGFVGNPYSYDICAKSSSCWIGRTVDGDVILGLFNREDSDLPFNVDFQNVLGLESDYVENVRDMWEHKDLGSFEGSYSVVLKPHTCRILRIHPGERKSVGLFTSCTRM